MKSPMPVKSSKRRRAARRKRVPRQSRQSQAFYNKRIREAFVDGFGFYPLPSDALAKTREAIRLLAADDTYWADLEKVQFLKSQAEALIKTMKEVI